MKINKLHPTRRGVLAGGLASGVLAAAAPALGQSAVPNAAGTPTLPPAPRDRTVDIVHGTPVPDPFRPLENAERQDVAAWVAVHDARTRAYLGSLPTRAPMRTFLSAVWDRPSTSIPVRYGSRYFATFNNGRARHNSYGVQDGIDGPRRTLIDPETLSADGTISIYGAFPNRRGTTVAYLVSEAGSDKQTLRVRDVDTGRDLPDTLLWCNLSTAAWRSDGASFFYTRYPNDSDPAGWDRESHIVCLHRLGEPQSADRLIFRLPALRDIHLMVSSAYEADLLLINARIGTSEKTGCYLASLSDPMRVAKIFDVEIAAFELIATLAPAYYALTRLDAPRGRLVRIDPADPRPERWRTVIPEGDLLLESVRAFNDRLVVQHAETGSARITLCDLDGRTLSKVDLGGLVSVSLGSGHREDDHLLLEIDSYQRSGRIERLDFKTGKVSLFRASAGRHDLTDAVVRQVFATSKDGTRIPLTLIHRPGIALDGANRTLLVGYGSLGDSQKPGYRDAVAAWVRLGGIYAIASVRGGGEFGQSWHDDGRLAKKQNSFDDFIACAEWLIANGYTQPKRLGSSGGSAGGLLVLASMLQRPDLFGAVVAEDAPSDMVRLTKATYLRAVNAEFGDVDIEADFRTMLAYSPLHNVRAGTTYPPLLLMLGDNDDRVLPSHSYKLVATLQDKAPASEAWLWVQRRAGHGGGMALWKSPADSIAFLCDKLGGPVLALPRIGN